MNRPKIEKDLYDLAKFLDENHLPEIYGERMGFILLVAPFNESLTVSEYVSNGVRETCIQWLEETLTRLKANETIPASKGNA